MKYLVEGWKNGQLSSKWEAEDFDTACKVGKTMIDAGIQVVSIMPSDGSRDNITINYPPND